jgi:hypothetical protein
VDKHDACFVEISIGVLKKRDGALAAMHLQGAKEPSMFDAVNLA